MKYKLQMEGRFLRDCKKHKYLNSDDSLKEPLGSALQTLIDGGMLHPRFHDHTIRNMERL